MKVRTALSRRPSKSKWHQIQGLFRIIILDYLYGKTMKSSNAVNWTVFGFVRSTGSVCTAKYNIYCKNHYLSAMTTIQLMERMSYECMRCAIVRRKFTKTIRFVYISNLISSMVISRNRYSACSGYAPYPKVPRSLPRYIKSTGTIVQTKKNHIRNTYLKKCCGEIKHDTVLKFPCE